MTDTIVCGVDHRREWMLQVVSCSCVTGTRSDFLAFFNTRAEAETHAEQLVNNVKGRNLIVKIIKIRTLDRIGPEFVQLEKENLNER